jgi:hypothetical protein
MSRLGPRVHPFVGKHTRCFSPILVMVLLDSFDLDLFNLDFLIKDGRKFRSLGVLISGT